MKRVFAAALVAGLLSTSTHAQDGSAASIAEGASESAAASERAFHNAQQAYLSSLQASDG